MSPRVAHAGIETGAILAGLLILNVAKPNAGGIAIAATVIGSGFVGYVVAEKILCGCGALVLVSVSPQANEAVQ